jgi:hypothetical protein
MAAAPGVLASSDWSSVGVCPETIPALQMRTQSRGRIPFSVAVFCSDLKKDTILAR